MQGTYVSLEIVDIILAVEILSFKFRLFKPYWRDTGSIPVLNRLLHPAVKKIDGIENEATRLIRESLEQERKKEKLAGCRPTDKIHFVFIEFIVSLDCRRGERFGPTALHSASLFSYPN